MVMDYGMSGCSSQENEVIMEEIAISKFKATCLAILERVRQTRRPIRVTRFGEPVAEVLPPSQKVKKGRWLGSMAGTIEIKGDIIAPASDERDWEVLTS
jgi:prevent-host-death family protein